MTEYVTTGRPQLTPTRSVPEHRIKTLTCACWSDWDDDFSAKTDLAKRMAYEILQKLFEFNKIKKERLPDGKLQYLARVEVIVPEGPPA